MSAIGKRPKNQQRLYTFVASQLILKAWRDHELLGSAQDQPILTSVKHSRHLCSHLGKALKRGFDAKTRKIIDVPRMTPFLHLPPFQLAHPIEASVYSFFTLRSNQTDMRSLVLLFLLSQALMAFSAMWVVQVTDYTFTPKTLHISLYDTVFFNKSSTQSFPPVRTR